METKACRILSTVVLMEMSANVIIRDIASSESLHDLSNVTLIPGALTTGILCGTS